MFIPWLSRQITKLSRNFRISVQGKIGAFFLAAILISSLVHVMNGLRVTTKEIRTASELQVLARVRNEATGLETFIKNLHGDLLFLRDLPPTQLTLKAKLDTLKPKDEEDPVALWSSRVAITVQGLMKSRHTYDGFLLLDGNGERLVDVRRIDGDIEMALEETPDSVRMALAKSVLSGKKSMDVIPAWTRISGADTSIYTGFAGAIVKSDKVIGVIYLDGSLNSLLTNLDSISSEQDFFMLLDESNQRISKSKKDGKFHSQALDVLARTTNQPKGSSSGKFTDNILETKGLMLVKQNIQMIPGDTASGNWTIFETLDLDLALQGVQAYRTRSLILFFVTLILISLGGFFLVRFTIVVPLKKAVLMAKKIESGNLSYKMDPHSQDEIGQLIQSIEGMRGSLSGMVGAIGESVSELGGATRKLGDEVSGVRERAQSVYETSKLAGTDLADISRNSATVGVQVAEVNRAVQEISSGFNEVAGHCSSNSDAAQKAKVDSESSLLIMQGLAQSAEEISQVLSLLRSVVKQTRFLAFNATIEATRAGEYGSGFGVVASEMRKLSSEAENSQTMIAKTVDQIVGKTSEAVSNIRGISESISDISNRSQSIAAAVEEQTAIVRNVSENLNTVDKSSRTMVGRIQSTSVGLENIGQNAQDVFKSLESAKASITDVEPDSKSLEKISRKLNELIGKFKAT